MVFSFALLMGCKKQAIWKNTAEMIKDLEGQLIDVIMLTYKQKFR